MQPRGSRRVRLGMGAVAAVAAAVTLAACGGNGGNGGGGGGAGGGGGGQQLSGTLNGSGSTFQTTFQQAAISQFRQVQPNMTVNYGSGGSGKGRSDLASGVTDFAGSDSPIPSSEEANFHGKDILYFPVVIGPITMSYNLPGVNNLRLTPMIIADIFQGNITNWNDQEIRQANPGVNLPDMPITTAVRSDSSGTTQNFSLFLMKAAPNWHLGSDSTINWPHSARAGSGNSGVSQIIKQTPGSIGYVDYADAKASDLHWASVQNMDHNFVMPSAQTASNAADGVDVMPNLTFASVWAKGAQSYPITYQSWVLVNKHQPNQAAANRLKAWINYLLGPGQQLLPQLGYARLPQSIDQRAKNQVNQIMG